MKVLIVDDHGYNRELLAFILDDLNYKYVQAENGEEAFQLVQQNAEIWLVLMDVMMPVLNGIDATIKIREHFPDRFLPIVFVTALDDSETLARCLEVGGNDFIPKPVNESVLIAKIRNYEETRNLKRDLASATQRLNN